MPSVPQPPSIRACGTSGRSEKGHQRGFAAQKTLLVGIQNGHQGDLRQIESLTQQIHPHEHVKLPLAELLEQIDPLEGVEFAVQPAAADVALLEIGGQVFRELFGQRGDEHAIACCHGLGNLAGEMQDLIFGRHDLDHRIEQTGGANHLLHHLATRAAKLPFSRCGRHMHRLMQLRLPFIEFQRPVVHRARQPETVVDERQLAAAIAGIHPPHLRYRDMRFIHKEEKFWRKIVEQRVGGAVRQPAAQGPGIVFNARAEPRLQQHLDVEAGARGEALRFQKLPLALELLQPRLQFRFDR